MKKTIVFLIFIVLALFILTGCNSEAPAIDTTGASNQATTEDIILEVPEETEAPPEPKVLIVHEDIGFEIPDYVEHFTADNYMELPNHLYNYGVPTIIMTARAVFDADFYLDYYKIELGDIEIEEFDYDSMDPEAEIQFEKRVSVRIHYFVRSRDGGVVPEEGRYGDKDMRMTIEFIGPVGEELRYNDIFIATIIQEATLTGTEWIIQEDPLYMASSQSVDKELMQVTSIMHGEVTYSGVKWSEDKGWTSFSEELAEEIASIKLESYKIAAAMGMHGYDEYYEYGREIVDISFNNLNALGATYEVTDDDLIFAYVNGTRIMWDQDRLTWNLFVPNVASKNGVEMMVSRNGLQYELYRPRFDSMLVWVEGYTMNLDSNGQLDGKFDAALDDFAWFIFGG